MTRRIIDGDRTQGPQGRMLEVQLRCPVCKQSHTISLTEPQRRGEEPVVILCPDLDRRYRLLNFRVDTRRAFYSEPVLAASAASSTDHLRAELGSQNFDAKFERWMKIDYPPLGVIDEYPGKIEQIINTYCIGYAYPAVTSSCCLAERILNRLVIKSRHHFKSHPDYKKIYRKNSFDDWEKMLGLISEWNLVPARAIECFRELIPIRHQSIHYNERYDFEAVAPATINNLIAAITEVFGVLNRKDIYLLFDVPGEVWVRSEAQCLPFVKEFAVPHCYYAHAVHDLDMKQGRITERLGKTGPLTDEEFVLLRTESKASNV